MEHRTDLQQIIALTLINGIGNILAKNLIAYLGSVEAIFKEKQQNLAKIPGIGEVLSKEIVSKNVMQRAEVEMNFIRKKNISACFYLDSNYPFRLKECEDAPVLLFMKGNINLDNNKFVSIVGTRTSTETGRENCKTLVADLSKNNNNIVIVSGLAYGIDICAHRAALENHLPTVAVLAHGLDKIYPPAHKSVAVKILDNGALLTEYLSGSNPDKPNFVRRNRIIAGLCDVTVVVETKKKGGSLITARCANDYNRDVFAFPGRVTDEYAAGCNELIKTNQAALIESAADILRFMNWDIKPDDKHSKDCQTALFADLTAEEQDILRILRAAPNGLQTNEIAIKTGKPFSATSARLLTMEFSGWVKLLPGNIYKALI
ncbi:MAG: DNA-processing protein DprA [Prevotellaceae bacterium]|jgi:DNA processing protein|nr:DNA-processing protein DprA [Prevotellaceae bacterium]